MKNKRFEYKVFIAFFLITFYFNNSFLLSEALSSSNKKSQSSIKSSAFIWKITPPPENGSAVSPSYILGTIHSIKYPKHSFPSAVYEYFSKCETFIMESSVFFKNNLMSDYNPDNFLPENCSINNLLKKRHIDSLKLLNDKMRCCSLNYSYQPWLINNYINNCLEKKNKNIIMDLHFADCASKRAMKIIFLETASNHYYNKIPLEKHVFDLETSLDNPDDIFLNSDYLTDSYINGDFNKLSFNMSYCGQAKKEIFDREKHVFINGRNINWLSKLEKHIATHPSFIIVRIAHLPGEEGLLKLLSSRGYKVENVSIIEQSFNSLSRGRIKASKGFINYFDLEKMVLLRKSC